MTEAVQQALTLWGFAGARCDFVAGRENRVYRVHTNEGDFALRLKRPGYRSEAELWSELQWLDAIDRAGLHVPRPRRSLSGKLLEQVGGGFADLIGWMHGTPLGEGQAPLALADGPLVFRRLGQILARLHEASDAWTYPPGFTRCSWDADGLLGEDPVWGCFWENPTLDPEARALLERFRVQARQALKRYADRLDYGLIHADPLRENVLVDGEEIKLLDFDDGGFGFRLFDIATALLRNMDEPDYPTLKAALLEGYREVRPLDDRLLDLFLALRAVTYVGWIVPRMGEAGAEERNARFNARASRLCASFLGETHSV
ncbi:phosphotransferase enzyme family protein [Mameliella sediminis]|uniref:phosphotransferase enzyme family protein n=1 Tax=Mameliella sediminis TaxID=2836866 RepID=UPI001C43DEB4|nr:phosphotransferase [Mameliella sediminis]